MIKQQVEELAMLNINSRLAQRLLILNDKSAEDAGMLKLSQAELVDLLGATHESINKILQDWRNQDLIELSRGSITAAHPNCLAAIAGRA